MTSTTESTQVTGTTRRLATADAEAFSGDGDVNTVSYDNAVEGVTVDLQTPADNGGTFAQGDSYSSIEDIIGSRHGDTLRGDSQDNALIGGDGDDMLYGGDGDDTLAGGTGRDTLNGGAGNDTLYGGRGSDIYVFEGAAGADTIRGDADGGRLYFRNAADSGGFIFSRNDAGDVVISVDTDSVTIENYANGRYSLFYGASDTVLGKLTLGTGEVDVLTGSGVGDLLIGLVGADTLQGFGGTDRLYGGDGDDTLEGGAGADYLDGGDGADTASYASSEDASSDGLGVTVNLATGAGSGDDAAGDTLVGIENLIGSRQTDTLVGNANANRLQGGEGGDTLEGGAGADYLDGGEGDDTLYGGDHSDMLEGGAGDDILWGGNNDDFLEGDDGDDILYGASGIDTLQGGAGADTLYGGSSGDTLEGGAGTDTYVFERDGGADTIQEDLDGGRLYFRNARSHSSFVFSRNDDGDAVVTVGVDSVVILAAAYADSRYSLHYGTRDTSLGKLTLGTGEADVLTGSGVGDLLIGLAGADTLQGFGGTDRLYGGDGDDTLEGGAGADYLNGGDGADTASYASSEDASSDGLGVTVNLATGAGSGDDAAGDTLVGIENLIGSAFQDSLTGKNYQRNTLQGGDGDDMLYGGNYNDILEGGDGDDTLYGGDGDDTLSGGDGEDTLRGGRNVDTLQGGAGDDTLYGGSSGDTLEGGDGDDILYGGSSGDTLEGGVGTDTYVFEKYGGVDTIQEDPDGGRLYFRNARSHSSFVFSRNDDGDAVVRVGTDSVTILATAYADSRYSLHYGTRDTSLGKLTLGTGEADVLTGSGVGDLLIGLAGADTLQGFGGIDRLYGGDGGDTLEGGAGADYLNGGGGVDTVSYASSEDASSDGLGVTVNLATGAGSGDDAAGDTLVGIENLIGSAFQDSLTGKNYQRGTLQGGDGDDMLYGGNYNDILEGGDGDDTLYGGDGDDTLSGGDGEDTLRGGRNVDTLQGGAGDDILYGGSSGDTLEGGDGDDILYGGSSGDTLSGGDGDDILYGGSSGDTLEGGVGTDTYVFERYGGTDTIRGDTDSGNLYFRNAASPSNFVFSRNDDGDAVVRVGADSVTILAAAYADSRYSVHYGSEDIELGKLTLGTGEDDVLTGTDKADLMVGLAGADTLAGGAGVDRLYGYDDADTLEGGIGADYLDGGGGSDTASYAGSQSLDDDGVTVNLATGESSGDDAEGDILVGIENLIGSDHDDTLTGNGAVNIIDGGEGDDMLYGYENGDTLSGGAGEDTLYGGRQGDFLEGGDGDDMLYGERGIDTLRGGADDDELYGGEGTDTLYGDAGADTLDGSLHDDILEGGTGADTYVFRSGDGADTIRGDDSDVDGTVNRLIFKDAAGFGDFVFSRNDAGDAVVAVGADSVVIEGFAQGRYSIHYGDSSDTALGRLSLAATAGGKITASDDEGVDLMLGSSAKDTFEGQGGDDTLYGYAGVDKLYGGAGDDTLYGGDAGDTLKGGAGNDQLHGGEGSDLLRGGADADTLHGGGGGDRLYGDEGADTLHGGGGEDSIYGDEGADTLHGGEGADFLDGGEGVDIASYATSDRGVRVSLVLQEEHQIDFEGQYGIDANQNHAVGDILSNIESIYGSDYIDWLTGDEYRNEIYGGAGNDRLEGGEGDDRLEGGAGNDRLVGGDGSDVYVFSAGDSGTGSDTGTIDKDVVEDTGGKIVFHHGSGNDYLGAIYALNGDGTVLTAVKDGNRLNIIEFSGAEATSFTFYTSDGTEETRLDPADFAAEGSEGLPFWATNQADAFVGYEGGDWVSYAAADRAGVAIDLETGTTERTYAAGDVFSGINNVIGSAYGDVLTGSSGDNVLRGEGGDDRLYGGSGNDRLEGGAGDDRLYGGDGSDEIEGGTGDDRLEGGVGDDTYVFNAGDGTDTVADRSGLNHLVFAALTGDRVDSGQRLSITNVGSNLEISIDSDGDGAFNGADDNKVILEGVFGVGSVRKPFDLYRGSSDPDNLIGRLYVGSAGEDVWLSGGSGDDILYGGDGNDYISGHDGNDILYGGDGNDSLSTLRGGNDILYGGAGADKYKISYVSGFDSNTIISDEDKGGIVNFRSLDALAIEYFRRVDDDNDQVGTNDDLEITISDRYHFSSDGGYKYGGATVVIEDYYAAESTFLITEGDYRKIPLSEDLVDLIAALTAVGGGDFTVSTDAIGTTPVLATEDSEVFTGDDRENTVSYANAGSYVLADLGLPVSNIGGFARGDTYASIENLIGSQHDDVLRGDDQANSLFGGAGDDILQGGAGNDLLDGGEGEDTVSYEDETVGITLRLGEGSEDGFATREGSSERDTIRNVENVIGSLVNDVITGNAADNWLDGRIGNDEIRGGAGNDKLYGSRNLEGEGDYGDDILYGEEGEDELDGGYGNDKLYGGEDYDILYGNGGDDTLDGGTGDDTLRGGRGNDTYVFTVGDGTDTIVDNRGDTVTLRFESAAYTAADFNSDNINRVDNNLVITIDKDTDDGITDKITFYGAYYRETGNSAFTINIEYGAEGSDTFTEVANSFWHTLA